MGKILQKIPMSNYKYYSMGELTEGVNRLFRYVKNFRSNTFEEHSMYIYVFNGCIVPNTFTQRIDSCQNRFETILNANGDYSKINFECKYKLEIF